MLVPVPPSGPFGFTNPVSPTQFLPGGTLPPSTHLEGRLLFLHETPSDALTFTLRCPLAAPDPVQAVYTAHPQAAVSRIKIIVRPSASFVRARKSGLERTRSHSTATVGKAADVESSDGVEVYLKEERERIKRLLNRNLRVAVGGMTVVTLELGGKTVTVQGVGPTWLQEGAKTPICLLDGESIRTGNRSPLRVCLLAVTCCPLTPFCRSLHSGRVQSGKHPIMVPHPYHFFSNHHVPNSTQFGSPTSANPRANSRTSPRPGPRLGPPSPKPQAHVPRHRLLCGSFTTPTRLGVRTLQTPLGPITQSRCCQACASSCSRTRGDPFALPRLSYE